MATRVKQYSIPLPVFMNKAGFQSVAEERIFIRNHDFHRSTELVHAALLG